MCPCGALSTLHESVLTLTFGAFTPQVKQAIELFTASTLQAAKLGEITLEGGGVSEGLAELRQRIEGMVAIGQMRGKSEIISQAVAWGFSERDAENAIRSLVGAEQFEESRQGRRLKRVA